MALWDIIRDFFVSTIFGGTSSNGTTYNMTIGNSTNTSSLVFDINGLNINIGDWLSTTSTIFILILLCIGIGLVVRWLFKLTSGLFLAR